MHTEPRLVGGNLHAADEPHARPRVVREEDVPVEVDVVEEARDVRARGDAEAGPDHAPEPERTRRVHHPHRLADAAGLRELDVHPVRELGARGDVGERVAVLVHVDRERRLALQLRIRLHRVRGERLLAVLDTERGELREALARLVEAPALVDVDLEGHLPRDSANRAHALDVETVARAQLELQPPEAADRALGAPRHVVGIAEPDRPARRRPAPRQPEQLVDGPPDELPLQVVQRRVDGRPGGELARGQPGQDLLERERIVAEELRDLVDVRERRLRGLVVALVRRRLAVAAHAVERDGHVYDVLRVARAARDDERLRELERDDARLDLHALRLASRVMADATHLVLDDAWPHGVLGLPELDAHEWGPRLRYVAPRALVAQFEADVVPRLAPFVLYGSGDFHFLSGVLVRRAAADGPVVLVSFDNHPDWDVRPPYWSCGGWAARASRDPCIAKVSVWGCGNFELRFPARTFADRRALQAGRLEVNAWAERQPPAVQARFGCMTRTDWRDGSNGSRRRSQAR